MFFCPTPEQFYYQPMTWVFCQPFACRNLCEGEQLSNFKIPSTTSLSEEHKQTSIHEPSSEKNINESLLVSENFRETPKLSEVKKMDRFKGEEEEFRPYAQNAKKNKKNAQNANRNIIPNIMHQVISFLQKKSKSERKVKQLISVLGVGHICSPKRFYLYQLLVKDKLNHYLNTESLIALKHIQQPSCEVYSGEEQRLYNKISRILVQHFLKLEYDSIILTSKRVHSNKRQDHIITKRKLIEQFAEMFSA